MSKGVLSGEEKGAKLGKNQGGEKKKMTEQGRCLRHEKSVIPTKGVRHTEKESWGFQEKKYWEKEGKRKTAARRGL